MDQNTRDTIDYLIRHYRLHERLPVQLDEILDRFTVARYDFTAQTLGFSIVRPREIHIGINGNLAPALQRQAEAHELSHIIAYHPHRLYTCRSSLWQHDTHEYEAQIGAALLLVPLATVCTYYAQFTPNELATMLDVPLGLIDLRWSYAQLQGEL